MTEKKVRMDFVSPRNQWELWLTEFVEETGVGNAGLFVEADTEEEAEKYLKNLIKIIKEHDVEFTE